METYTIPIPVKDWDRFRDNYHQGADTQGVTSQDGNSLLVLAHGTREGEILFRGNIVTPREFIERNITTLKRKGVKEITFLSCHCGTQESGTIDGISFAPMFPEKWTRSIRRFVTPIENFSRPGMILRMAMLIKTTPLVFSRSVFKKNGWKFPPSSFLLLRVKSTPQ